MNGPASNKKRRYVAPCHCPLCKGKERDSRTVVKHTGLIPPISTPSAENNPFVYSGYDSPTGNTINLQNNKDYNSDRDSTDTDEDHSYEDHPGEDHSEEDHHEEEHHSDEHHSHLSDEDHTGEDHTAGEDRPDEEARIPSTNDDNEIINPAEILEKRQNATGLSLKVIEYIMKELQVKLNYGTSRAEFEEHLKNVKGLVDDDNIPVEWEKVMELLKILGYNEPRWFRVCIKEDHSYLLRSSNELCAFCRATWKDCIDYFVLGLGIDDWFTTDERCHNLMSHWEDRESWFCAETATDSLSELWHGERFKSLSWFWDPQRITLLPGINHK